MFNNVNKVGFLLLYFITLLPLYSYIREERELGLISIACFALYIISFLIEKQNLGRLLVVVFTIGIAIISFLTNQNMLFVPLAMLPYILYKIDDEADKSFINIISIIVSVSALVSFLFGSNNNGTNLSFLNLKDEIALATPYVFAIIANLLYYILSNNDNKHIAENRDMIQEIQAQEATIADLKKRLKLNNEGLQEEDYLAVVLGLDFDGFNYDENVAKIIGTIKNATKAIFVAYYNFEDKDHSFHLRKNIGESYILSKKPIPAGIGIVGAVYNSQQYSFVSDLQNKEKNDYKRKMLNGVNSLLAIPIIVNNKIIAAISLGLPVLSKKQESDIVNLCCIISSKANIEFAKLEKHEKTEKQSITDELTGLYNRLYFDTKIKEQLTNAQIENNTLAFVEIDLDFFKQMNDTHGHAFGDKVLKIAASVFKNNIRKSDYAFRTGGDEFGLLLLGVNKEIAFSIVKNIVDVYAKEVEANQLYAKKDGQDVKSSFSIGIAIYPHKEIQSTKDLINLADKAVYHVKENGKNNIAIIK